MILSSDIASDTYIINLQVEVSSPAATGAVERLLARRQPERIAVPASSAGEVEAVAFYYSKVLNCLLLPGSWKSGVEEVLVEVVDSPPTTTTADLRGKTGLR